jgi:hypothetical protein
MNKLIIRLGRIIAVGLIIVGLLFIGLVFSEINFHATFRKINHTISRELPKGTDVSQVKLFLDSYKFEYEDSNGEPPIEIAAIKRNVGFGILTSGSIALNFNFDEHNKLVAYTAREVCTGP